MTYMRAFHCKSLIALHLKFVLNYKAVALKSSVLQTLGLKDLRYTYKTKQDVNTLEGDTDGGLSKKQLLRFFLSIFISTQTLWVKNALLFGLLFRLFCK